MEQLLDGLHTRWLGRPFAHFEELSSTNDYLKENARALPHGAAVTADHQTAGRGRSGKAWQEGARDGLALSVLLKPPSVHHTQLLPLVCALAVKSALYRLSIPGAGIKWPNDIVVNGKKVCGILCEGVVSGQEAYAVCGMGINVMQDASTFAARALPFATSLYAESGRRYEIDKVAAAVLDALERYYDRLLDAGFDALCDEYMNSCVTIDKEVRVIQNGAVREGRAVGLARSGALLVTLDGVLTEINAGEASVRGLYGYV
ncbi:MAG: biotin--[acetyl-CoA-carboxylase] ligase [Acetanaerobacterium sp.]